MKKDSLYENKPAKTYFLGRVCQYCGEPIEDQARASRTHCPRFMDEFGVMHDCRRKKHQVKHQEDEAILLDWSAAQRQTKRKIEEAVIAHGDEVTLDVLDAYNIKLQECIRFNYLEGSAVFEFLGYDIIVKPNLKTYKIQKNDKSRSDNNDRKIA